MNVIDHNIKMEELHHVLTETASQNQQPFITNSHKTRTRRRLPQSDNSASVKNPQLISYLMMKDLKLSSKMHNKIKMNNLASSI
jgi:hypothetical protein